MAATSQPRGGSDDPVVARFRAALTAALPERGAWAMPVVVGVSGGADSVALLHAVVHQAPQEARRIVVAHAEHDLRSAAAVDRRFVGDLASALGLECHVRRLAVQTAPVDPDRGGGRPRGEGLEARARRLRYDFLADTAHAVGARYVLVAHTADDQAETILHRVLRGTGLTGLGGMARARPLCDGVALFRPLLDVPRHWTRAYLSAVGQAWREDETNTDTTRARNFLRHEVLPRCEAGAYPAASAALVRLAARAKAASRAVEGAAGWLLDRCASREADGTVRLRSRELAGLDPEVAAEVVAALWRREGWPRRDMTARHYDRVAAFLLAPGVGFALPGGVRISADAAGQVRLTPSAAPEP